MNALRPTQSKGSLEFLYLLGIDHGRLTFYHNSIDRRLTNVHGRVMERVVAEGAEV